MFYEQDVWMESMLGTGKYNPEEGDEKEEGASTSERRQFTDDEVASVLVTFLFASQDASTSSLVWVMELLYSNPDVLQKVREELHRLLEIPMPAQEGTTSSNEVNHLKDVNFTPEILAKAEYTRQVNAEDFFKGSWFFVLWLPYTKNELMHFLYSFSFFSLHPSHFLLLP